MHITIIGAGPGISYSVARLFGKRGFSVALIARNEEKLQSQKQTLESEGIEVCIARADAGNETELIEALGSIKQQSSSPDVVLYNVYAPVFKSLERETWESLSQQLNVNVGGAFHVLKNLLPEFKRKNSGKIFITGGGLGMNPLPNFTGLSLGKAALRNLVWGTAASLNKTNVHLGMVTVCGYVKQEDPKYNPDQIALQFWKLYEQKAGSFETEIIY